jgi:hypothetical protein
MSTNLFIISLRISLSCTSFYSFVPDMCSCCCLIDEQFIAGSNRSYSSSYFVCLLCMCLVSLLIGLDEEGSYGKDLYHCIILCQGPLLLCIKDLYRRILVVGLY